MKLKIAIFASSLIITVKLFANTNLWYIVHPMPNIQGDINTNILTTDKAYSFEESKEVYNRFFPIGLTFTKIPAQDFNREELLQELHKTNVFATAAFYVNNSYISNAVSGVVYTASQLATGNEYNFIKSALVNARQLDKGVGALLKNNSLVAIKYVSGKQYNCLINFDSFFYNVINNPSILTSELINENLEVIKQYLSNVSGGLSDLITYAEAIELNQQTQLEQIGRFRDYNIAITNSLKAISLNSAYAASYLLNIEDITKTFAQDQRIKQLASGETFATLARGDGETGGIGLTSSLNQLIRLNYLKQGRNITDRELMRMTDSEKWTQSGMSSKYGSFSDNMNNGNIGKIVAVEAITENQKFQDKVSDLSSLADENGNVIDPLTGELTKLNDAIANWDKAKTDGALASYSYNNPAATNGFFGAIKRNLTEEGDWRLLDKGIKEKQESFMDNLIQDGVKVNPGTAPLEVIVSNDKGISVNIPDEIFQTKTLRTSNATLDKMYNDILEWYDDWIESRVLWSNFTGVQNHNDRGYLDLMLERNDLFYLFVTNNIYGSVSNQLAKLIELNETTNKLNFVDVPRATYVRYLMRGIGTTDNNDDDLFAIKDEPTFTFDGSTNFEQAVAFQLHDLFEVSQNGSKADMMSADFIRGIYRLLGTGSNLVAQVEYITNTVYNANGLSTDKNDYSSYEQEKEKLEADLEEVNTILEDMQSEVKEKINYVSVRLFADYTLPKSVTLLEFNNQKFEIDLYKWSKIFDMMHMCSQVAWLAVGLLMLPRVIYMLLCFGLRMLGKFYNIMRS